LAVVNDVPITVEDLKYSLQIAHRKENLSSGGNLNISQYMQKVIDDALIAEETRRMDMERYPEVQQAINSYILRESVVRLHNEEILQKVFVSEKDIIDFYKRNYEKFSLGLIEVNSEEEAMGILEQIKSGGDFKELAGRYSTHTSKEQGGEINLTRKNLSFLEETLTSLKPGEFSNVIKNHDKYYIVKLISRQEAPDEEFNKISKDLEQSIRKRREKERSDEYLLYLRKQTTIKINNEILSAIRFDQGSEERNKWVGDKRPLAEVNDTVLTAEDFVAMVPPIVNKTTEDILNDWIEIKLVDQEALKRHYELKPPLEDELYRYKNQLLKNTFIKNVIVTQIKISDNDLKDYYLKNQKDYLKPTRFKIQQITVKTMDEAQDILNNLQNGADFSWLARKRSIDAEAQDGGFMGWLTSGQLSEPEREIVNTMKPGDLSPILQVDSSYKILMLQEKTGEDVEEFNEVKGIVFNSLFKELYHEIYDKYIAKLKEGAQIKIYDEAVRSFEDSFKK
jgi:parvulin-like peptidyl-prolyl isomerase